MRRARAHLLLFLKVAGTTRLRLPLEPTTSRRARPLTSAVRICTRTRCRLTAHHHHHGPSKCTPISHGLAVEKKWKTHPYGATVPHSMGPPVHHSGASCSVPSIDLPQTTKHCVTVQLSPGHNIHIIPPDPH